MRKQKSGKIIVISSMASIYPVAFIPFYNASKAALTMLAKSLEVELEPYNIGVTAVLPGGTATNFTFLNPQNLFYAKINIINRRNNR